MYSAHGQRAYRLGSGFLIRPMMARAWSAISRAASRSADRVSSWTTAASAPVITTTSASSCSKSEALRRAQVRSRSRMTTSNPGGPSPRRKSAAQVALLHASVEVGPRPGQEQPHRLGLPLGADLLDGGLGPLGLPVLELVEQRPIEVGLAGEVVVEAADAGPGPLDHLGDARLGEPLGDEDVTGGVEEGHPGRRAAFRGAPDGLLRAVAAHAGEIIDGAGRCGTTHAESTTRYRVGSGL